MTVVVAKTVVETGTVTVVMTGTVTVVLIVVPVSEVVTETVTVVVTETVTVVLTVVPPYQRQKWRSRQCRCRGQSQWQILHYGPVYRCAVCLSACVYQRPCVGVGGGEVAPLAPSVPAAPAGLHRLPRRPSISRPDRAATRLRRAAYVSGAPHAALHAPDSAAQTLPLGRRPLRNATDDDRP